MLRRSKRKLQLRNHWNSFVVISVHCSKIKRLSEIICYVSDYFKSSRFMSNLSEGFNKFDQVAWSRHIQLEFLHSSAVQSQRVDGGGWGIHLFKIQNILSIPRDFCFSDKSLYSSLLLTSFLSKHGPPILPRSSFLCILHLRQIERSTTG